jgi:VanZ family protein
MCYWLAVVVWAGVIFYCSSMPSNKIPPLFPYADVVFHFYEYFVFYLLVYWAASNSFKKTITSSVNKILVVALIMVTLYAISDEFHQLFVPGRQAEIKDVLIDFLGAFSAAVIVKKLCFRERTFFTKKDALPGPDPKAF